MRFSQRCCAQLGLGAAFVVLGASISTLQLVPRCSQPLAVADVGTVAPDFELPDVSGATVRLADLQDQVVVLFFSSLAEPKSALYDERIERLARLYADDARVKVLAINIGSGEHIDPMLLRLNDQLSSRSFPTLLDEKAYVATRYSAAQAPFMVVIDPHGVVRYRGPFDNNPDIAFASHSFVAECVGEVLKYSSTTVAQNR